MSIQTVKTNLEQMILAKEAYQEELAVTAKEATSAEQIAIDAMVMTLDVTIHELKQILQTVEQSVVDYDELKDDLKEANGRVRQLERQASADSWITNPDRMGGGGWSADELDPNRGWK